MAELEKLRAAVERDFSQQIHVSHGLFRSPYPFGEHLLCEVDTGGLPGVEWGDGNSEFVLRVTPLIDDPACLKHTSRLLNTLHGEVNLQPASFRSLVQALGSYKSPPPGLKELENHELQGEALQVRLDQLCQGSTHPNVVPLIAGFRGEQHLYLVYPPAPFTLRSILRFSPLALGDDGELWLLLYQIIAGLEHCHSKGVAHGNLTPSNVLLTGSLWCRLTGFGNVPSRTRLNIQMKLQLNRAMPSYTDWERSFSDWQRGELSNYDYLLILNRLAGRRWGDRCFHTVMPWVIDFTAKPEDSVDAGWRDLTRSKWRLAKGDEQLDFTYSTADIPHHVSDECLSELAVCIYKARRLPLLVLRRVVRSVYEPNEYPGSMQRLYQWTPDECIPEFFSDPRVFRSSHQGMSDLVVPAWARDPEEFVSLHRAALESDRVSVQLHHWIDLTFGYKLSGEAAVEAKNVTLSTAGPGVARGSGRFQLFSKPHPARRRSRGSGLVSELEELQESSSFTGSARFLSPSYGGGYMCEEDDVPALRSCSLDSCRGVLRGVLEKDQKSWDDLLKGFRMEPEDEEASFQRLVAWKNEVSKPKKMNVIEGSDLYSVGCFAAELYLRKPLVSCEVSQVTKPPLVINQLPPQVRVFVEALLRPCSERPNATQLLESPFFPPAVRVAYKFLYSFHFLTSKQDRLHYASKMAQHSAFLLMGEASQFCAPACLSIIKPPYDEFDPMEVAVLLKSLLQALKQQASRRLIVPLIQSILQNTEAVQLKAGLLTSSFIRNLRRIVGTSVYLQHIHGLIVLNVLQSGEETLGNAASVVLVDACLELGLPVTFHQTILRLLRALGRDITAYGIDTIVDIGERFGEQAIARHWLPPLRFILLLSLEPAAEKNGPAQSWRLLAAVDAMVALDRLISKLSPVLVLKEFIQEPNNVFFKILQHKSLPFAFLENAVKTLLAACNRAGPDLTLSHAMPQLKQLFDELVFGDAESGSVLDFEKAELGSLVSVLYPGLASLLGIEKLRHFLPCWLLVEQSLAKNFDWKLSEVESHRSYSPPQEPTTSEEASEVPQSLNPANLFLNGVGWSVPQSQAAKWTSSMNFRREPVDSQASEAKTSEETSEEPWFWVPAFEESFGASDSNTRIGAAQAITKDDQLWKLSATIAHSWRGHSGSVRASKLGEDESVIFTAGGLRGKSLVRKWELSTTSCIMEYSGHEEAVNNICVLQEHERVASCDGTLHIWSSETGKRVALFAESSGNSRNSSASETGDSLSNGILSGGNVYTFMHSMDDEKKLVVGTASGYLRFLDVVEGRQLYSWRCEPSDTSFSSFISSVSSNSLHNSESKSGSSWIAIGFGSGHCSLLDSRSGSVIGHWRAHAAEITHLASLEDNYLVSSSLDRTLCIWDFRKGWPLEPYIFQGHSDAITSFSLWGTNILSAAGNKIGVASFSKLLQQGQRKQMITPRKIYTPDRSSRNLSTINSISVLPFSRQFIFGTDDGHLKICL